MGGTFILPLNMDHLISFIDASIFDNWRNSFSNLVSSLQFTPQNDQMHSNLEKTRNKD